MSTIKATTLSNLAGSKTVPTDTVVDGSAKAWVNFNGTGTVAIRRAFNVSSITDNGTGDYTVNFTNAMVDASYAVSCTQGNDNTANAGWRGFNALETQTAPTTSAVRVGSWSGGVSSSRSGDDSAYLNVAIFS